eukprot:4114917-Prymnesium_polylepis.1
MPRALVALPTAATPFFADLAGAAVRSSARQASHPLRSLFATPSAAAANRLFASSPYGSPHPCLLRT